MVQKKILRTVLHMHFYIISLPYRRRSGETSYLHFVKTATIPMVPYVTTLNFHDISNVHVQGERRSSRKWTSPRRTIYPRENRQIARANASPMITMTDILPAISFSDFGFQGFWDDMDDTTEENSPVGTPNQATLEEISQDSSIPPETQLEAGVVDIGEKPESPEIPSQEIHNEQIQQFQEEQQLHQAEPSPPGTSVIRNQGVRTITTSGTITTSPGPHEQSPSPPDDHQHYTTSETVKIEYLNQEIARSTIVGKIESFEQCEAMYVMPDRYEQGRLYADPVMIKFERDDTKSGTSAGGATVVDSNNSYVTLEPYGAASGASGAQGGPGIQYSSNGIVEGYYSIQPPFKDDDDSVSGVENPPDAAIYVKQSGSLAKYGPSHVQQHQQYEHVNPQQLVYSSGPGADYAYMTKPHIQNAWAPSASGQEYVTYNTTSHHHQQQQQQQNLASMSHQPNDMPYNIYQPGHQWQLDDTYDQGMSGMSVLICIFDFRRLQLINHYLTKS
ncbi:unnamed protein product [Nesidiocoris tenuis]|uniref:Uncharacterized protein n=1 Tax=Nesidiocoris tenuis TaxID=355587 RepID=A0A6H5FUI9_9HEMI|nr:unnamed protein product [Nesidiocoris tenuis]